MLGGQEAGQEVAHAQPAGAGPSGARGSSCLPAGDLGRFVATEWLSAWADGDPATPPPPIDNSPLLCPHGRLDPAKMAAAKRISTPSWEQLQSTYKGGPQVRGPGVRGVCAWLVLPVPAC